MLSNDVPKPFVAVLRPDIEATKSENQLSFYNSENTFRIIRDRWQIPLGNMLAVLTLDDDKNVIGFHVFDYIENVTEKELIEWPVRVALLNHAKYVVLVHNHFMGDLTVTTKEYMRAMMTTERLRPLQIRLLDHMIVTQSKIDYTSVADCPIMCKTLL
ncbi:MAG: JAB domain-containing protein [Bacteroidales bacterium]|nr:JAB domain-containing protein [Bacteroidales bacterium]MDD3665400.1 JAB domain-containing protein [Bacteroidales bacterium]